ncbi:MAG: CehA/McbA family metallohydrolase [Thermoleophilaceae bacterium]
MAELHDVSCVIHVHSTHSDGTGTVPEIARAGERTGTDVVLLTDHDDLSALHDGEEGWYGRTLLLAGHEISPVGRNHMLAFGLDSEVRHCGLTPAQIAETVRERGGFGIAAHPFSTGSKRFSARGLGESMEWQDLEAVDALEVWSFVADNGQDLASVGDAVRFVARPERRVTHPPRHNLAEWDRLGARKRVVGIGGLDAHQFGVRVGGRALRLMSYARSFRQLRTNVLCDETLNGDLEHDRAQVLGALRAGRCYIAVPHLGATGAFRFHAESPPSSRLEMGEEGPAGGWTLHVHAPRPARLRLLCDGAEVASVHAPALVHLADKPGAYRVEVSVESHGAERTWILSNPIYLR